MYYKKINKKLFKSAVCLLLTCVLAAGSAFMYPKETKADILVTVATKLFVGGVKFIDRQVVAGLEKSADEYGDPAYQELADLLTLPGDKAAKRLQETCDEILSELKEMRTDMNALNQSLDDSIAALQRTLDKTNLSDTRREIVKVIAACDNIISKYESLLNISDDYAEAVLAYNSSPASEKDKRKAAMDDAKDEVDGALTNFENAAKDVKFDDMIDRVAAYACKNFPYYVIGAKTQQKGAENTADTDMDYANSYANDIFAFEHQKYDFLVDEMNSTAYAFTKISMTNRMWVEYLDSKEKLKSPGDSKVKLKASDRQNFEVVLNKVIQGINDISEQCEKNTKGLMRPYDVNASVPMFYADARNYSYYRDDTHMFLETKLAAVDTQYVMDFYRVKPIGKPYPFLVAKNGLNKSGPKTEEHLTKMDSRKMTFATTAHFSTMDLDFYNILQSGDGRYNMPKTPADFNYFINDAYKGVKSDIYRYLTEAGGLDKKALSARMSVTPLNDWHEAGYQISSTFSDYYCHYFVLGLAGFNPSTPNNTKFERKADKKYSSDLLVVLKGDDMSKFTSYVYSKVSSGTCNIYDSSGNSISISSKNVPGTQLTAKFRPNGDKTGLVLAKENGEILETLIDPESYDLIKDSAGVAEVSFTMPYQSGVLMQVSASDLGATSSSAGTQSAMSANSLDSGETFSAQSVDDNELDIRLNSVAQPPVFTDIGDSPAKEDIEFLASYGVVSGMDDGKYSPNLIMTRGMFVTALSRLTNMDTNTYRGSNFSDISTKSPLRPYIEWAYKNGLVSGQGDWKFKPDDPITREQMAVILAAFLEKAGAMPKDSAGMEQFSDSEQISEWAKDKVSIICGMDILNAPNGRFNPKGSMTRAETASAFAALLRAIGK